MSTVSLVFTVPGNNDAAQVLISAIRVLTETFPGATFHETSANAMLATMEDVGIVQAVPVALPFKAGQSVIVDGDKVQGEATILDCWAGGSSLPSKAKWNRAGQAYPQVEVEMLRTKKKYHFNGEDIDEGKLTVL